MEGDHAKRSRSRPPFKEAVTSQQRQSIAEFTRRKKYALYENVTLENRSTYFNVSTYPITKKAEDDMELLSDIVTWGEIYRYEFRSGKYKCARCLQVLYSSDDKWNGPCVWPSFRSGIDPNKGELEMQGSMASNGIRVSNQNDHTNVANPHVNGIPPPSSLLLEDVYPYNNYTVTVQEVYCGFCRLFIGHAFEDGPAKGDNHSNARWRH